MKKEISYAKHAKGHSANTKAAIGKHSSAAHTPAAAPAKELKSMSRKELLELLLIQTERAEELEKKLDKANSELNDKKIVKAQAGTMAEAAMKLNGIFEAADKAAEQYLENIRTLYNK